MTVQDEPGPEVVASADELHAELQTARRQLSAATEKLHNTRQRARTAEQESAILGMHHAQALRAIADLQRTVDLLQERDAAAQKVIDGMRAERAKVRTQIVHMADRVSRERQVSDALRAELTRLKGARPAAAPEGRDQSAPAGRELQRRLKQMSDELGSLRARYVGARVYSDPERQLRHDVELSYLARVPESQREQYALRTFTVAATFCEDLDRLSGTDRQRAVDVIVDVLSRRAADLPARRVRRHGVDAAAAVTTGVSRPDGASAWRCNVQDRTPQARRLVWWELRDNAVELCRLAAHDDVRLA